MPVAPAEDEDPANNNSAKELAEFAAWGAEFIDFLHNTPTAEQGGQ